MAEDFVFVDEEKPKRVKKTKVKLLNHHAYKGKYIIEDKDGDFYLVPTQYLELTFDEQSIAEDLLVEKPQDFTEELSQFIPTVSQVLRRLYTDGTFEAKTISFNWTVKGK